MQIGKNERNILKVGSNRVFCKILTLTFFFFFIILISASVIGSILYVLIRQGIIQFIDPNRIYVPEGKVLYDMETFTFRNHTLYRYDLEFLILDENEEFEEIVAMNDENEDVVILAKLHDHEEGEMEFFEFECSGICECFINEGANFNNERKRRVSNVIFSTRYYAIVLVSMLGFATAKFINDHIDDCYHQAKESLGYNDVNIEDPESDFLTCSMGSGKKGTWCKHREKVDGAVEAEEEEKKEPMYWDCNGHCLHNNDNKLSNPAAQKAIKDSDCKNKWAGSQRIQVREKDLWKRMKHQLLPPEAVAKRRYRDAYLSPYCKAFQEGYLWAGTKPKNKKPQWRRIRPCASMHKALNFDNIKCKKVKVK